MGFFGVRCNGKAQGVGYFQQFCCEFATRSPRSPGSARDVTRRARPDRSAEGVVLVPSPEPLVPPADHAGTLDVLRCLGLAVIFELRRPPMRSRLPSAPLTAKPGDARRPMRIVRAAN